MKKLLILLCVGFMSCTFTFKNSNAEIIEYKTYDLGTQEDLYNGLEDNEQIIASGTLEFPLANKCKDIDKYPVMFLIHHSGGDIMPGYKEFFHNLCVATFEPHILKSRGHNAFDTDTSDEVVWVTEVAGAVDSLLALDVVAQHKKVNSKSIGILGWSWGGSVAIETQNKFFLDRVKTKNTFVFHYALYPYCFQYEDTQTSDAPLMILMGDEDAMLPHQLCVEYIESLDKDTKDILLFEGVTHSYDIDYSDTIEDAIVSNQCRMYFNTEGELWMKPDDPTKWFNLTSNGGWFGDKGDPTLYANVMDQCWGWGPTPNVRDEHAIQTSLSLIENDVQTFLVQ